MSDNPNKKSNNQNYELSRYSRQIYFEHMGSEGQQRLRNSRAVLFGCGGLGTNMASILVRAGIGFLRIVDRDVVEISNLHRQMLYNEDDVKARLPKAEAARRVLQRANSDVAIEAVVTDIDHRNIEQLADGVDLLLDGTDNIETRFLINDLAVKSNRPWIYGACTAAWGRVMPILPHKGPCLRCIFEEQPPPEMVPTCDTVGVLGPVVSLVASLQALEGMKILMGRSEAINRKLLSIDAWTGRVTQHDMQKAYNEGHCLCCKQNKFEYLDGKHAARINYR